MPKAPDTIARPRGMSQIAKRRGYLANASIALSAEVQHDHPRHADARAENSDCGDSECPSPSALWAAPAFSSVLTTYGLLYEGQRRTPWPRAQKHGRNALICV